jgi:molecular chaperone HscB
MTSVDSTLAQDHFTLFGLPRSFAVDGEVLERMYREIQAQVHPDKHAHLSDTQRRLAMQWATRANEAHQVLKNPLQRAHYLLGLLGFDPQVERNTAMPMDFLMEQMDWREAVEKAKGVSDGEELENLHRNLRQDMKGQYEALGAAIDGSHDYVRAADLVRQLMFQEKLLTEIEDALEAIEA